MNGQQDLEAFARGLANGQSARLVLEGLPVWADKVERALCVAGFECARIAKGQGRFPVLVHAGGRTRFWLVANDGPPGTFRPLYQANPDKPAGQSGYYGLRSLFRLKGEPLS